VGRSHGTIAPGKAADLVVLDADPTADISNTRRIALVVRRGRVVELARPAPHADGSGTR
jgi:imidazolonepropionase-like amidohydrolase